jgi:hypothetical protein
MFVVVLQCCQDTDYRTVLTVLSVIKLSCVRFEVFTAVTMKIAVFWDVAPCRSYVNRRFGGTYCLHFRVEKPASKEPAFFRFSCDISFNAAAWRLYHIKGSEHHLQACSSVRIRTCTNLQKKHLCNLVTK